MFTYCDFVCVEHWIYKLCYFILDTEDASETDIAKQEEYTEIKEQ